MPFIKGGQLHSVLPNASVEFNLSFTWACICMQYPLDKLFIHFTTFAAQ